MRVTFRIFVVPQKGSNCAQNCICSACGYRGFQSAQIMEVRCILLGMMLPVVLIIVVYASQIIIIQHQIAPEIGIIPNNMEIHRFYPRFIEIVASLNTASLMQTYSRNFWLQIFFD